MIVLGIFMFVSTVILSISIGSIAAAINNITEQIHVHAEVMTEIKHQGIGIDNLKM